VLDKNKIFYKYLDVSIDKIARDEMVSKTGKLVVPVVEVDGEISIGYDERWLKAKLNLS
jgi:glutaredoxin